MIDETLTADGHSVQKVARPTQQHFGLAQASTLGEHFLHLFARNSTPLQTLVPQVLLSGGKQGHSIIAQHLLGIGHLLGRAFLIHQH
jgi:hypothetical protein